MGKIETELFESLEYLVEKYVSNKGTEHEFVKCIILERVPWYWRRAKQAVERYKKNKMANA